MKKGIILFVSILALGFSFSSCSGDDNEPTTSGNIVGKWEYYKAGEKEGSTEYLELYEHQSGCAKDNIEYKSDGTFLRQEYNLDCSIYTDGGTYTKSGNNLTTVYSVSEQYIETIKELSNSTLKVYETYTEDGETYTDISVYKRAN